MILAKRLSDKDKELILKSFTLGKTLDELSNQFNCSKLTITRNLKKNLGEIKYKELIRSVRSQTRHDFENEKSKLSENNNDLIEKNLSQKSDYENNKEYYEEEYFSTTPLVEIEPLNFDIDASVQKDLSSIPIADVNFPNTVYMIVDKKIELEIKYLNDYPLWQFLSKDELSRKTIEIYDDIKNAKRFCNKEQKVIKVPNTNVFKIVAPYLLAKGISRIITSDKLIAL